ncbi:hypothetical protein RHIZ404_210671 [Rhizobium sp. EC-SD404]|nr:hypothetical protein RHIZ404_210671 [Rhizobium sp. EC-SD404]
MALRLSGRAQHRVQRVQIDDGFTHHEPVNLIGLAPILSQAFDDRLQGLVIRDAWFVANRLAAHS